MIPTEAEIDALLARLNNWNRWGPNDQLGTLNLIDEKVRREAASLIRTGEVVALGRPIDVKFGPHNQRPLQHHMLEVPSDSTGPRGTSSDWFGLACHGFATTHVDALCHQSWRGQFYNGRPATTVKSRSGASELGVDALAAGVFAPAILFDVPRSRGVPWLNPGEAIDVEDLTRCLPGGVSPAPGSVLVITTGREARVAARGEHDPVTQGNAGLAPLVADWLAALDPALVVTDTQCDVMLPGGPPHAMTLHVLCLVGLGVHLVDNAQLDGLASKCAQRGDPRFAFAMTVPRLPRSTGAPVNPIALL